MSRSLTKHRLKKQLMEKTLQRATERGEGRRKENPKVLPYYKLDFDERMDIMFVPYEDGELFKHFKKHGPNMKNAAVGTIDCIYHSRGESCPACAKGFSYVVDGKGTPESRAWMAKDYYVAQCVVVDSPFDIEPLEDGNQVRIFYMPFAVMEKIRESYAEGIIEDPTEHVFVIKKSKSKGGDASYANSYFRPEPASDEIFDAFADEVVEVHDLLEEGIEPEEVTLEEVEEWVEKAEKLLAEGGRRGGTSSNRRTLRSRDEEEDEEYEADQGDEEEEEEAPRRIRTRLGSGRSSRRSDDDDSGSDDEGAKKAMSLKERLRQSRAR